MSNTKLTQCTYVKRDGLCTRQCYDGRCWQHKHRESHKPCQECGHGTRSLSEYCRLCAPNVGGLQVTVMKRLLRERKRYDAALDACVDELLA